MPVPVTTEHPGAFHLGEEPFEPSGLLLTASGELDIATVPELRERLAAAIDAGVTRLVVDLRPLDFIDSVALAALLHARKLLGDEGRVGIVASRDSYTRLVFEIAGLPHSLNLFETPGEAIDHVA